MSRPGSLSKLMNDGKGPHPNRSRQRRGPLRAIVKTINFAENMFDENYVELECGHRTRSNGIYKARCTQCAKENE